ncbi:uncharacterized protein LOC134540684 [Bacillus rossius redtenbacheri]|uniref:uncharacterized protein LOC134540684 n=1 Tax=Bacillus rossius redtenbacheri TaxID=93214 RepID=UPI002FDEFB9D
MEPFYSLLVVMGLNSAAAGKESDNIDFISKLPVEIAQMILRQLDSKSLLAAALVSRRWLQLCRSDAVLRGRVRRQLRREQRERSNPRAAQRTVLRDVQAEFRLLAPRNGQLKVQVPEQRGHPMHASRFWNRTMPQARLLAQGTAVPRKLPQHPPKTSASSPANKRRRMRL